MIKSFEEFDESFDDLGSNKSAKDNTAETINLAQRLLDRDYLPMVKKYILSNQRYSDYLPFFSEFKQINLFKEGWRFQLGTSKEWAGLCSVEQTDIKASKKARNLYVSIDFVKHDENWKQNATDTILHEIAHAIVREVFYFKGRDFMLMELDPQNRLTQGHGRTWDMVCSAISGGKVCDMYYRNAKLKDSFKLYKYECSFCGNIKYGNTNNFAARCSKCFRPIMIQKNY